MLAKMHCASTALHWIDRHFGPLLRIESRGTLCNLVAQYRIWWMGCRLHNASLLVSFHIREHRSNAFLSFDRTTCKRRRFDILLFGVHDDACACCVGNRNVENCCYCRTVSHNGQMLQQDASSGPHDCFYMTFLCFMSSTPQTPISSHRPSTRRVHNTFDLRLRMTDDACSLLYSVAKP